MLTERDNILSEFTENVTSVDSVGYVYGRCAFRDYSVQSEAERAAKMVHVRQVAAKIPWKDAA